MQLALLLAQVTNSVPGASSAGAFSGPTLWIDLLTPIVTPLLTAGAKKLIPSLPAAAIPPIAIVLGVLANGIGTIVLGQDVVIWKAVALSLAGVGIRELQHNFRPAPQT